MRGDRFFTHVASKPPFSGLGPPVGTFFKDYLAREKVIRFGERWVCPTARDVLEHLLKSGAGTAFYGAIDPRRRKALTDGFLNKMEGRRGGRTRFDVTHEYLACVARREL